MDLETNKLLVLHWTLELPHMNAGLVVRKPSPDAASPISAVIVVGQSVVALQRIGSVHTALRS